MQWAQPVPVVRQALVVVVVVVVVVVAVVVAVDMVAAVAAVAVAVDMAAVAAPVADMAAADIWVEVASARVAVWAVAARRPVRAAPRQVTTLWPTTAPGRAPMPSTRSPANMRRTNTNMRHPISPAQIIIITTTPVATSPDMAISIRNISRCVIGFRTRSIPGSIVTVPLSPRPD